MKGLNIECSHTSIKFHHLYIVIVSALISFIVFPQF